MRQTLQHELPLDANAQCNRKSLRQLCLHNGQASKNSQSPQHDQSAAHLLLSTNFLMKKEKCTRKRWREACKLLFRPYVMINIYFGYESSITWLIPSSLTMHKVRIQQERVGKSRTCSVLKLSCNLLSTKFGSFLCRLSLSFLITCTGCSRYGSI